MELFYTPGLSTLQQLELNRVHKRVEFWKDVNIAGENECWIYVGAQYGGQLIRTIKEVCWTLEGKEIPDGYDLRHSCKKSKCCNPDHIYLYRRK